jgi:hypothetical protein
VSGQLFETDARAELELLASRLAAIEERLNRLESHISFAPARPAGERDEAPELAASSPQARFQTSDIGAVVALLGRTLFVLAGAFLLRAATDSGWLNGGMGVLLGLAFAATWIVMAHRSGGRGQRASAAFHGLAFILIALPLVFEATTRFHFLNAAVGAAGIGVSIAIALVVSWRTRLQVLAWIASLGGVMAGGAIAVATAEVGPFAVLLVLLGVATLWLGYVLEWTLLRWPIALIGDLTVLVLSVRAVHAAGADRPAVAFAAQTALLIAYLGSFATRTLVLNRDVIPFEVAQSVAAILTGLGGAVYLTHMQIGGGELLVGAATLILGAACYSAAAIFVERRQSRRRNYYFYTSAGLVFALAGGALAMPSAAVGIVYAAFGMVAATAGRLSKRVTYRVQAAVYLTAAAAVIGLLPHVLYGLGLPVVPVERMSKATLSVLALCGAALWGLGFETGGTAPRPRHHVPRTIVLVLVIGGMLSAIVGWVMPPASTNAVAPGLLATVRTALLVAAILALALADRVWGFVEGAWLVYPLLMLTGLKFVLEDYRAGQPATLFVGFALYGLALFIGPRLCRGAQPRGRSPLSSG